MPNIRRFANAMTILHLQVFVLVFAIFVFKIAANIDKGIFFIFIGSNHTDTKKMWSGDDFRSLKVTHYYDDQKPSVLYIHGWQGKFERRASQGIVEAYLSRGDHNIIFLDWSQHASQLNYVKAARGMNETTESMAKMMMEMRRAGFDLRKFHLIGYSFGAHYAGQIGEYLKNNHNILLTRITGLEPAGPMFFKQQNADNETSNGLPPLQKGQAKFVDIIHTDAGLFGTRLSTGDVDFWANGGRAPQPGCDLKTCYARSLDPCVLCSHDRSWKFFAETVKNNRTAAFKAKLCNPNTLNYNRRTCNGPEVSFMGFYADKTPKKFYGNYYVETSPLPPFSRT